MKGSKPAARPGEGDVDRLLEGIRSAAAAAGFGSETYAEIGGRRLPVLTRAAGGKGGPRVYLSSGIHGDEPAGPHALLELLRTDALPRSAAMTLFPVLNPVGLAAGTRENEDGIDLNRDYTAFASAEIRAQRDWLLRERRTFDLALHLHEDWEAAGFYTYELNFTGRAGCAGALLEAAAAHLPLETAERIDGHPTVAPGLIRPESVPEVPQGLPEAIYFQTTFGGLNYTLETPSALPLEQRIAALAAAVTTAVGSIAAGT